MRLISLFVLIFASLVMYIKINNPNVTQRTVLSGSDTLPHFDNKTTPAIKSQEFYIIERDPHELGHSFVMEQYIYGDGTCSDKSSNPPAMNRICTPFYRYHVHQNVTITVVEGKMGYLLGDRKNKLVAKRGQTVRFPAMQAYTYWSETEEDLTLRIRIDPPLKSVAFVENYAGLMMDAPNDVFNLVYTSLESDYFFGDLSVMANRALSILVELLAKVTGKRAYYHEYTTESVPLGYGY